MIPLPTPAPLLLLLLLLLVAVPPPPLLLPLPSMKLRFSVKFGPAALLISGGSLEEVYRTYPSPLHSAHVARMPLRLPVWEAPRFLNNAGTCIYR
jgi:hypothetical protein